MSFPYEMFYNFQDHIPEIGEYEGLGFYHCLDESLLEAAYEEALEQGIDWIDDPERFQHFLDNYNVGVDGFDLDYDHLTDECAGIRCRH